MADRLLEHERNHQFNMEHLLENRRPGLSKGHIDQSPSYNVCSLVEQKMWILTRVAVQERPQDVRWTCNDQSWKRGQTALHGLCLARNIPSDAYVASFFCAAEALLHVAPDLLSQRCADGSTPLYLATKRTNNQKSHLTDGSVGERLVIMLIHASPRTVDFRCGVRNGTCFHLACQQNASTRVLQTMLEASSTPKDLAQQRIASLTGSIVSPIELLWQAITIVGVGLEQRQPTEDDFTKMELLLKAATGFPFLPAEGYDNISTAAQLDPNSPFNILWAIFQVDSCPKDYVLAIIAREPDKLEWPDAHGMLPVHHAMSAANTHLSIICEMLCRFPAAMVI